MSVIDSNCVNHHAYPNMFVYKYKEAYNLTDSTIWMVNPFDLIFETD